MADNILKNEFMQEEKKEKKPLYKNWKLYATALAIILIGTSTGLGIYYGTANHSQLVTIGLNTLNTQNITGTESMTENDAFNAFIANQSKDTSDLRDNVDLSFVAPNYVKTGSLTITAKAKTKYTGSIRITINAVAQKDINDLGLTINLDNSYTDKDQAFEAFLSANSTISDLQDNVEPGTFTPSDYGTAGSLEIKAKANTKYTGIITVNFKTLATTTLSEFNTNPITGTESMTENDAFNAFIANQSKDTSDLRDNVDLSFVAPNYVKTGSLTITAKAIANNKYTGTIEITINSIEQPKLNDSHLGLKTEIPKYGQTNEIIFLAFLNENKNILKNDLTREQVNLSAIENNKLTISVKEGINSKYTGSIEITITTFILSDENLPTLINFLSNNNLLNFEIPTGTEKGSGGINLLYVIENIFKSMMEGNYEYAKNIQAFQLWGYNQAPNQEQLDTKGFVWKSPAMFIIVKVYFKDGTTAKDIKIDNIFCTMKMV